GANHQRRPTLGRERAWRRGASLRPIVEHDSRPDGVGRDVNVDEREHWLDIDEERLKGLGWLG
ncbi:MAG: hypothetical protein JRG70_19350, partial [Deltaproteobacteria bacterium]|nr:hypothetical protein [Deltaproteobacteria bacterium]